MRGIWWEIFTTRMVKLGMLCEGFRGSISLKEAGKAQVKAGTSDPSWGSPGLRFYPHTGSGSFGDDPVDQYWIQQGVRYHDETK